MAKSAAHATVVELGANLRTVPGLPVALRSPGQSVSLPLRKGVLVAGDLLLLNLGLLATGVMAEGGGPVVHVLADQVAGFNALYAVWLVIFYGLGLYDIERLDSPGSAGKRLTEGFAIVGLLSLVLSAVAAFPRVESAAVALDLVLSAALLFLWRLGFLTWTRRGRPMTVLVCGTAAEVHQVEEALRAAGGLGYRLCPPVVVTANDGPSSASRILERLAGDHVDIIAITRSLEEHEGLRMFLYRLLCAGVHVTEASQLSGELTGKIPVTAIDEGWFLENLREFDKRGFEMFKRVLDVTAAIVLGAPTLLLFPLIALAIRLDSAGPVLFRQKRVGRGRQVFEIAKFRTMVQDAEKAGARWTVAGDPRITGIGRLLRQTRIDELPQLWNVLKGEMSFVGPRPERPEFVEELARTIPFYDVRHLVKPGLTGWAQIKFRYGASVEDTLEKVQYDLYYIKHRSVSLDLGILVKTLGTVLRSEGR